MLICPDICVNLEGERFMIIAAYSPKAGSILLALLLCGTAISQVLADDTAAAEFRQRAQTLGDSISSDNAGESERCRQLAQDVQRLKGRPQQRFSAQQLYDLECRRSMSAPGMPMPGTEPGFQSGFEF